jgi:GTP-binding protein
MAESNFVDYVKVMCRSGHGGAGSVHFLRTRYTAKGGPDGGDGGRGGHIILRGNKQLWTLLHLKYRKHIIAGLGEPGEVLFEITADGEEKILAKGGRGGLGNDHFKTSTLQAPRFAQPGEPGEEKWRILELKVLADVGLVGFPNAGKSTLLSKLSAAKPEIANYPFTTLTPQLGIVPYRDFKSFIMADIPGIIEGAHEGRGLGLRFLRHIERNSVLLFLIPADSSDIKNDYNILLQELEMYNPELLDKKRMLAISKCDMTDEELRNEMRKEIPLGVEHIFISSHSGLGLVELKDRLWQMLNA